MWSKLYEVHYMGYILTYTFMCTYIYVHSYEFQ